MDLQNIRVMSDQHAKAFQLLAIIRKRIVSIFSIDTSNLTSEIFKEIKRLKRLNKRIKKALLNQYDLVLLYDVLYMRTRYSTMSINKV